LVLVVADGIIFYREDKQAGYFFEICRFAPDIPPKNGCPALFVMIMTIEYIRR